MTEFLVTSAACALGCIIGEILFKRLDPKPEPVQVNVRLAQGMNADEIVAAVGAAFDRAEGKDGE